MPYYHHIKKYAENSIRNIERKNSFAPKWFSIIFNPFFISRFYLYKELTRFASAYTESGKKILDVGCGTKPYKSLFKNNNYIGIDIDKKENSDRNKKQDIFFDGETIPFGDEEFDIVITTEVFEHVENLEKLTKEINRVLKENGILFITTPFVWPEHETPYDFRRLTTFGHKKLLSENNFTNIKINKTTGVFGTSGQIISAFFTSALENISLSYKTEFILKRLINILICFPIQLFFLLLDIIFRKKGITLDYIVLAEKYNAELKN